MLTSPHSSGAGKSGSLRGLFYLDLQPIVVHFQNGIITRLERVDNAADNMPTIAPGLIDNQVNGYMNVGFTDEGLCSNNIKKATRELWKVGVTSYLPTLITSSFERLHENFSVFSEALKDKALKMSIPGYHLEGPYISPRDGFRGAHTLHSVRQPDWDEFQRLQEAAAGKILQVTLAPEVEGATEFIAQCVAHGVVVALGHHAGSTAQIKAAADAGASIATHLGNGCANTIHRHDNPLWAQLADDRLMASLICDGFHLRPEEMQVFYKCKGADRIIITSDTTGLAGMPPGTYMWDGKEVVLTPEGIIQLPEQNVLAGASLPAIRGIENMMRVTQCSLAEAIHMASRNPARLYKLDDRGEIVPGKRADFVLLENRNGKLKIQKTYIEGNVVFQDE